MTIKPRPKQTKLPDGIIKYETNFIEEYWLITHINGSIIKYKELTTSLIRHIHSYSPIESIQHFRTKVTRTILRDKELISIDRGPFNV